MNYNSTNYISSVLNNNLIRTLAAETALGYYKILLDLDVHNEQTPIFDADKLEQFLRDTGFLYDPKQNIFYSRIDPWQRSYGYCRLYDEAAAPLSMIIDCEPIRFEYGNKKWLIELWKGQYGMTTGGEIGVFTTNSIPNFYQSVTDRDCLPMSFVLKKEDRVLFSRNDTHWWLTGFVLGEFSEPSELVMDVTITLRDHKMSEAFVDSLIRLGYSEQEIGVDGNTVTFAFSTPHSAQPHTRTELISKISQKKNKFLCQQYQNLAKASRNMHGLLQGIEQKSPELFGTIVNLGRSEPLFQAYESILKYLGTSDLR